MKMRKKFRRGFTLVELVVVIAVIAILSAVSVGAYFGITDSANSSNATQGIKQIQKLWTMYSVSDYEDQPTAEDRAIDFCLRYAVDNGPDYEVNYAMVGIDALANSSIKNAYGAAADNEAILFKVETAYPTWFIVSGQHIVEESTTVLKTQEEFNASFVDSRLTSDFETKATEGTLEFKIEDLGTGTHGKKVRGFGFYKVNINFTDAENQKHPFSFDVKPGTKISDIHYSLDAAATFEGDGDNTPNSMFEVYEGTNSTQPLNTNNNLTLEHHKIDIVNHAIEGKKYSYYLSEPYNITSIERTAGNLNLDSFKLALVEVTGSTPRFIYSNSLSSVVSQIKSNSADYNFIFTKGYTVKAGEQITIPGKTSLIVDFLYGRSDMLTYMNMHGNGSNIHFDKIAKVQSGETTDYDPIRTTTGAVLYEGTGIKKFNSVDNILRADDPYAKIAGRELILNEFTVENGASLSFTNGSYFMVEGLIVFADSSRPIGVGNRGQLTNHGEVILDNSYFRSLGETVGSKTGVIKAKGTTGSHVIEVFKPNDYKGGSYIGNAIMNPNGENRPNGGNIFPFLNYQFDNIKCNVEFYQNSDLSALTFIDLRGKYIPSLIKLLSENNDSLFTTYNSTNADEAIVTKSHSDNKMNLHISGEVSDGVFSMEIDMEAMFASFGDILKKVVGFMIEGYYNDTVSSKQFNFPISNMNIFVEETGELRLDTAETRYEFMPTSYLEIKGSFEIGSGTRVAVVSSKDCILMNKDVMFTKENNKPSVPSNGDKVLQYMINANFDNIKITVNESTYTKSGIFSSGSWGGYQYKSEKTTPITGTNSTISQATEYKAMNNINKTILNVIDDGSVNVSGKLYCNSYSEYNDANKPIQGIEYTTNADAAYSLNAIYASSGIYFKMGIKLVVIDADAIIDNALSVSTSYFVNAKHNISEIILN